MRTLALLALLLSAFTARAQSTFELVHNGLLLDAGDLPVTNQSLRMTFRLFAVSAPIESESPLWTGEYNVRVERGRYGVALGSGQAGGIPALHFIQNPLAYLEVTVENTRLLPRLKIGAVPIAATALTLGGRPASEFALKSDLGAASYSKAEVDAKITALNADASTGLASKASASDLSALAASVYTKAEVDSKVLAITSDTATGLASKAPATELAALAASVYTKAEIATRVFTKDEIATQLDAKANASDVYSRSQLDTRFGTYLPLAGGNLAGDLLVGGKLGIGRASPVAALDVAGGVRVGSDTGSCDGTRAGTLRFTNGGLSVCLGSAGWAPAAAGVAPLTDAASIAVDATRGTVFTVTLGGNRTLENPTGLVDGTVYTFRIKQDATGGREMNWGSRYFFNTTNRSLANTADAVTIFTFTSDGTNLYQTGGYNVGAGRSTVYFQCSGQVNYVAFVRNTNNLEVTSLASHVAACKSYGFRALGTTYSGASNSYGFTEGTDYIKAIGCHNCYWSDGGNAWYYSYYNAAGGSATSSQTSCSWVAGTDSSAGNLRLAGAVVNSPAMNLNCGTLRGALGSATSFGDNTSNYTSHPLVYAAHNANPTDTCARSNTTAGQVVFSGTPAYLLCASTTKQ